MLTERNFFIPKDARKVDGLIPGLVAYFFPSPTNGNPCAIGFHGTKNKPDFNFRFPDAERATQHVSDYFSQWEKKAKEKLELIARKKAWSHNLKEGDILQGSWGYDQTNQEFWQIIEVKGKSVIIRELSKKCVSGNAEWAGQVVAEKDSFVSDPVKKIPQFGGSPGGYVKIHSCCHVSLWDGKDVYESHYA